jgi:dolichyl-diphosphooligosaccharide--protein glycosyltransferase
MVKLFASLRNFQDRIRASVSIKTRNLLMFFALFLLFILTIVIRLTPLLRGYTLIKAFDPWIQYYNAEYLSTHSIYEYFHWYDFKSWYPTGIYRGNLRPGLTFTVVIIYHLINSLGFNIPLYDVCYFFPAFMGGITIIVTYFLGKEVHGRGTGLIAAFFLVFNPGYMQRTMAGFFDNETIGVFATLMCFLFYLKALRTGKFVYSILSGIFLGYLSLSWGGYQFVYLIIPLITIIIILVKKYNENILISYAGVQATGLLIASLYVNFDYSKLFSSLDVGGIFLFSILLIFFHLIYSKKNEQPGLYNGIINIIKVGIIPLLIIFAIILWVAPDLIPLGLGARFQTILNPLFREQVSLVASVAEQNPSAWGIFYYNTLIPLILIPLGIYFCFKRLDYSDIFMIILLILLFYFTGSMIRIILLFGPAACLVAAYGLVNVLKIYGNFVGEKRTGVSRKRRRQVKGTLGSSETFAVYLIVGFLCIAQVVHASNVSINSLSYTQITPGSTIHDWEESLTWMRTNLPGTDVVVSWWDYGYWLTPIGNVTTVNDNATRNSTRIGLTGMAFMQTNELYSAEIFKELKADYVLVYFGFLVNGLGGDEGKWPWMVRICNDNYERYKQMGLEKDNWADDAVFRYSDYQNTSSGAMCDAWFQSQLVKLMFWGEPTTTEGVPQGSFQEYYANQINNRKDNDGDAWVSHIPTNGQYDSNVFIKEYFSTHDLVKLFKVDYTALESKFMIENPEVFDSGYATFKLDNIGTRDLEITDVKVNGISYDFTMGKGISTNVIDAGDDDLVWVDIKSGGTSFNKGDVVKINVTAQSEALENKEFTFWNYTSNFFVKEAKPGAIKINKENSKITNVNNTKSDAILEVENTGESIVVLDRFYVNNDTPENRFNELNIEYLSGSSVLNIGENATIYLPDSPVSFYPIGTANKIGVASPNDIIDEVLMTASKENYSITIYDSDRIISPEVAASIDSTYRNHIPIDLEKTFAYAYDNNNSILLKIRVKNTGETDFKIGSIYLSKSLSEESKVLTEDYKTELTGIHNPTLKVGKEDTIIVTLDADKYADYINGEINEDLFLCVTGSFGSTVTSDAGYLYTIKNQEDIQIIKNLEGIAVSYINANETGRVLVKNTGNKPINLENVIINSSLTLDCSNVNEVEFLYGDSSLDVQECALISFDLPGFQINKSNEVIVRVTTNTTAEYETTFYAIVDSEFYAITVDPSSRIDNSDNKVTIKIVNNGKLNVTLDSIYINETYISPSEFNFEVGDSFEIGNLGGSITITMTITKLKSLIGIDPLNIGDKLIILARTVEGAEDTQEALVVA